MTTSPSKSPEIQLAMQRVQRRFGRLLPRTADESQVALLLKDFEDADKMLERVGIDMSGIATIADGYHRLLKPRRPGETPGETSLQPSNGSSMDTNQCMHL